jgi:hypothetical protein
MDFHNINHRKLLQSLTSVFLLSAFAVTVQAHVKWFFPYDVNKPPLPIGEVLDGSFVNLFLASVAGIYLFFLVDRYAYKQGFFAELDQRLKHFDTFAIVVMRVSAGLFFATLFLWWALGLGQSFYLTPELTTSAAWVPWLQLVMGLCVISARTTPIAGLGILVLWLGALSSYGIFHMLDYPIFLGIGYYLGTSRAKSHGWLKSGLVVMFATTGLTLLWAAVEKFAYPSWTIAVLAEKPGMLMGLTPQMFMKVSGMVEMSMIFILLGAASVVGRLVALGLMSVFVLAVFEFGFVDAVGHLMIVAILWVLIVRGPTDAREMLVLRGKSVFTEAYFMTGLYFLAVGMIFILYYGIHFLAYGA